MMKKNNKKQINHEDIIPHLKNKDSLSLHMSKLVLNDDIDFFLFLGERGGGVQGTFLNHSNAVLVATK